MAARRDGFGDGRARSGRRGGIAGQKISNPVQQIHDASQDAGESDGKVRMPGGERKGRCRMEATGPC